MSQSSLVIPTTGTLSGLQLVNAINDAVDNLVTQASGSTDPSTLTGGVKPYSFWLDTSVSPNVLRMRNAANTAWAAMGTISANNFVPNLENADIATALGYTPVNKAGDTMTGNLTAPNVFGSVKVQAPEVKVTTKLVFPDNSEQITASNINSISGGSGINITDYLDTKLITNTGILSVSAGTGIGVSSTGGVATVSNKISGAKSERFTASGTFTIPEGITSIKVTVIGGGGGGGGVGYRKDGGSGSAGGTTSVYSGTESIATITSSGGGGGSGGRSYDFQHNGVNGATGTLSGCDIALGASIGNPSTYIPYGSGGDGGVASDARGGSGGSAIHGIKYLQNLTPLNTLTVTIGAGGAFANSDYDGTSGASGFVIIEW